MNRELKEQDWLDFYEAEDMVQVEICRKGDLLNYYGPFPERWRYLPAEWKHYAESQMWLDKAAEILTTKNKSDNYKTINKMQLAFILDYKHEDVEIPQAVILFITDRLRGVGRKKGSGTPKSIVKKWGNRKIEYGVAIDAYGDIWGAKPTPDLPDHYHSKLSYLRKKHGTNTGYVKKALEKYNPKNR